uniref:Chitin-binding type-2 domain-containing protein n=1 Tax=Romanomermis culicivorax TaxID=13658 RepID=A0A915K280_ROMCU
MGGQDYGAGSAYDDGGRGADFGDGDKMGGDDGGGGEDEGGGGGGGKDKKDKAKKTDKKDKKGKGKGKDKDCPVQLCGNDMGGGMYRFSKSPYTFLACSQRVKFCVACPQSMEMDYNNLTCVAAQKLITTLDLIGAVITKFEILDEIADMHTVAHLAPSDLQASACTDCPIDRCFGFYGIYVLPDSSDSPTIIVCSKTKRFCAKCPENSKFDLMKKKCIKSSTNSRDCKIHRSCIMERELVNNSAQGHTLLINEGGGNRFQICNNKGASMCGFCPKGTKFDLRSLNCVRKFSCNRFQCPLDNQFNDSIAYPNPYKPCSQSFYICIRGSIHPIELACPQNLFYDPLQNKCLQKSKIDVCKGYAEPDDSESVIDRQGIATRSRNCLGRCLAAGDDAHVCMYICYRRG